MRILSNPKIVGQIAKDLFKMGCYEISLGDTTGKGTPEQTLEVVKECLKYLSADKLAGHFHDTYQMRLITLMSA